MKREIKAIIMFKVTSKVHSEIESLSDQRGESISAIIREALAEYLANRKNGLLALDGSGYDGMIFEDKWIPEPNSGCWLWEGSMISRGYGQHCEKGKMFLAHRFAWIQRFGAIPNGLCVCHRCDTPLCVNPSHLFLGTHADNKADMIAKGRLRSPVPKLTAADVITIRKSNLRTAQLAKQYNVDFTTIRHVQTRKAWKHIL